MHEQQTWTLRMCLRGKKKIAYKDYWKSRAKKAIHLSQINFNLLVSFVSFLLSISNKREEQKGEKIFLLARAIDCS